MAVASFVGSCGRGLGVSAEPPAERAPGAAFVLPFPAYLAWSPCNHNLVGGGRSRCVCSGHSLRPCTASLRMCLLAPAAVVWCAPSCVRQVFGMLGSDGTIVGQHCGCDRMLRCGTPFFCAGPVPYVNTCVHTNFEANSCTWSPSRTVDVSRFRVGRRAAAAGGGRTAAAVSRRRPGGRRAAAALLLAF